MASVGILALQGGFDVHAEVLRRLGHEVVQVRNPTDFEKISGLIFPGGESSVQLKLIDRYDLESPIKKFFEAKHPILATCAGMILCARTVKNPEQKSFGFIDIDVQRNAWGAQIESFEATSDQGKNLVFIRAPRIYSVGDEVDVLETFAKEPVLVRQQHVFAASFHPELAERFDIHEAAFGRLH